MLVPAHAQDVRMQGDASQSRQVPSVTWHNRPPPLEDLAPGIANQTVAKERAVPLKMIEGQTDRREANHQDPLRGEARAPLSSVSLFCAQLAQVGSFSLSLFRLVILCLLQFCQ
jgi:hypothetical protein